MRFTPLAIRLAATAALLASAASAHATVTLYTSQASFSAVVNHVGVDTYNTLAHSVQSPATRMAGDHPYTVSIYTIGVDDIVSYDNLDPNHYPGNSSDVFIASNHRIDFDGFTNISAFGGSFFSASQSGVPQQNSPITLFVQTEEDSFQFDLSNVSLGSFTGVVSTTPIVRVSFSGGGSAFQSAFDNLTLAQAGPVPEPQSYALMAAGLGVLGALARRRRALR